MSAVDTHERMKRVFLVLIVVTALATLGNGYLESTKWQEQAQDIKALQDEVGTPNKMRQEVSRVRNDIVEQKLLVQHLEQNVSTRDYVPTMLSELQDLGLRSGLRVTGVRPQPKKVAPKPTPSDKDKEKTDDKNGAPMEKVKEERKPYDELDVEVEGKGHFGDVVAFLQRLTSFPKIIAVRGVTINTVQTLNQTGTPDLDVKFVIRAYIFKERPASLSASAAKPGEVSGGG